MGETILSDIDSTFDQGFGKTHVIRRQRTLSIIQTDSYSPRLVALKRP